MSESAVAKNLLSLNHIDVPFFESKFMKNLLEITLGVISRFIRTKGEFFLQCPYVLFMFLERKNTPKDQ